MNIVLVIIIGFLYLSSVIAQWKDCATENELCKFEGNKIVRFGNNKKYYYTEALNSIMCDTKSFNGDPNPNILKKCQFIRCNYPDSWSHCAKENEKCNNPYYGSSIIKFTNGNESSYRRAVYMESIICINYEFRNILNAKTEKNCYICSIYENTWGSEIDRDNM